MEGNYAAGEGPNEIRIRRMHAAGDQRHRRLVWNLADTSFVNL